MPRNKYPEVTEKAILDTAKRLFLSTAMSMSPCRTSQKPAA